MEKVSLGMMLVDDSYSILFNIQQLVDLHFPHESYPKPEASRRSSSIFDLSEFKVKNPADLLRNVMEPKPGTVAAIRGEWPLLM